ncbi:MAG: glycosyltransferase involved in cell wall biosynthesis [Pseudohongiellaceae bacterium]|jgi:glycosyltransferase involved in cell wall biosynthesis
MAAELTIAHVDTESGFSGGQVQVFLLMEGLARAGVRNVLFCRPGSLEEQRARELSADGVNIDVRVVSMRGDWQLSAIPRLARGFAAEHVDLVHLHTGRANWLGGWAARRAGLPAITTRRMDRPIRSGLWTRKLYGDLVSRAAAISPAVARLLAEGGVPPQKIVTLVSAVDPAAVQVARDRNAVRREFGVGDDELVILGLARLTRRKGFDVLLDGLAALTESAELPPWRCWLGGNGEVAGQLQSQASRLGLADRVKFLGHRDETADLLGAADVFVMPSRAEGLGIAGLEAMAAGLPIVASRVGGLADAVSHDETGLLVPSDDPTALRKALEAVLSDSALRQRLGDAGPGWVAQRFSPQVMVDGYLALYREVLAEQQG